MSQFEHKPDPSEHPPYFSRYIDLLPDAPLLPTLQKGLEEEMHLWESIDENQAGYRYAPEKWSIKEMLGHVIDTERIFTYRALCFAREEQTALPGFDHDQYVIKAQTDQRLWPGLVAELKMVRQASLALFGSFSDDQLTNRGRVGDQQFSVRSIGYLIAGHEKHHLQILEGRYLDQR